MTNSSDEDRRRVTDAARAAAAEARADQADKVPARGGLEGERYPAEPYAGAFTEIESTGKVTSHGVSVRTTHNFTSDRIKTNWTVDPPGGAR